MHRIFISYRRSEAAFAAGALGRELKQHFGEAQVFRDREDVEGGMSWRAQVLSAIDHDSALLVLIDEHWLEPPPGRQKPRLFDADDPVRLEILDALHDGATIIPLLLEGVEMPTADALPSELQSLSEINALPLRDGDWPNDLARVCSTLERLGFMPERRRRLGSITPIRLPRADSIRPVAVARPTPLTRRSTGRVLVYLFGAAALAAAARFVIVRPSTVPQAPSVDLTPAAASASPQPSAAAQSAAGSPATELRDASVAEPTKPSRVASVAPPKARGPASAGKSSIARSAPPKPVRITPQPEPSEEPAPLPPPPPPPPHNPLDMRFQ